MSDNRTCVMRCHAPATMGGFQYTLWIAAAAAVAGVMYPDKAMAYNNLALAAEGVVVFMALLIGIVNAAHEGLTMKDQWNSVWVPIVLPLAFGITVPLEDGRSAGQMLIQHLLALLP